MRKLKIVNPLIGNTKIFSLALCISLVSCVSEKDLYQQYAFSEEINVEYLSNKLDDLMPSLMEKRNIRGVSLAIIQNSKVILVKSYGVQSAETQIAVTSETVYEFASLSKPVFSLAVLQLAKEGKIDLDTPLYKYLEYQDAAHDARYKLITARIVLSHTTGFPNWGRGERLKIAFTPGEQFRYSGQGYVYLQKVVEKITGKPLQQIVQEQVFTPIRMTHSSFIWKDEFEVNMAYGHSKNGQVAREISKWEEGVSASSLITDVRDYSKFVSHILNEYRKGNPIIRNMVNPKVRVKDYGKWGQLFWSLGWGIEDTRQGRSIWHWGDNGEYRSLVVANLENGIGLVYASNSSTGLRPIAIVIQNTIGGVHPLTRFNKVH